MSTNVLEAVKGIGNQVGVLGQSIAEIQALHTKSQESTASYGDDIKKANDASEEAMAKYLELKAGLDSVQKTQDFIEKSFARNSGYVNRSDVAEERRGTYIRGQSDEINARTNQEIGECLKKNQKISDEVQMHMARSMVDRAFPGATQDVKDMQVKSLVVGNDPKGGYWIMPELLSKTIQRIFETSPIRGIADVISTSTSAVDIIIEDTEAQSGGWVGEVTPRGETNTPTIGQLTIPIHTQFAQPKITEKMLEDAGFDVQSFLNRKVAEILSRTENTAFVVGDGSQKPRGFLTYPNWDTPGVYERFKVEQIASGALGAFTADGIKILKNSVVEDYQRNAIFGLKRASWSGITTLKDDVGQYYLGIDSLKEGDTATLYGRPVIFMNDMPDVADDALAMVYGDFSVGYTIADRMGIRIIRDELTDKPFIKYYTTKRVGGAVTNYQSLKLQKLVVSL